MLTTYSVLWTASNVGILAASTYALRKLGPRPPVPPWRASWLRAASGLGILWLYTLADTGSALLRAVVTPRGGITPLHQGHPALSGAAVFVGTFLLIFGIPGLLSAAAVAGRKDGAPTSPGTNGARPQGLLDPAAVLRVLMKASVDTIVVVDRHGRIMALNEAGAASLGESVDGMKGRLVWEFMDAESAARRQERLKIVWSSGQGMSFEDQSAGRYFENRLEPLLDDHGRVTAVVVVARMVTARHEAECERALLVQRLADAQRIAELGYWDWDLRSGTVWWSDQVYRTFGIRRTAFGGSYEVFLESVHPDDRDAVRSAVDRALSQDEPYDIEHRVVHPDDTVRWVRERAEVHRTEGGDPIRMVGTVLDITSRRTAENRAASFWSILDRTLNEIYIFDAHTLRFRHANRGALENLGYTLDELKELTPLDLKSRMHSEAFKAFLEILRSGKRQRVRFSAVYRRKNGTFYPVEVDLQQTTLDDTPAFVAITTDTTEHDRVSDGLRRLAGAREQAREEERRAVARDLHDDLGQTLSALAMDLTAWREEPGSPETAPKVGEMLELVNLASESSRRIIERLRPGPLEELGLVAALAWLAQDFTERTGLTCQLDAVEDTEQPDEEMGTVLYRVAQEALTNVRRHANAETVLIRFAPTTRWWRLTVEDNGVGRENAGAEEGLGLLGMRERVELMGGHLVVDDAPGGGTRVRAFLPRAFARLRGPREDAPA